MITVDSWTCPTCEQTLPLSSNPAISSQRISSHDLQCRSLHRLGWRVMAVSAALVWVLAILMTAILG